ncbi:sulfatase family protein [Saccharicrinis aurantiacus]|uniref:sulfatase family protein n=1 Tax=Saccharicrinis aurantiacus TaxID=1849719 RepID=UPI000837B0B6|nr:sulfatase-like hydrolase/transferase [Saccharicrinis aurantiacus]
MRLSSIFQISLFSAFTLALMSCSNTKSNDKNTTEQAPKPNILVVLCDDLGYSDVGFNGSKDITTPALDALANEGTVFSSAYVVHPFCGPSRAGLMTGRYPHKLGAQFNLPPNSETIGKGIPTSETFISKVLQDAGYYTGAIGKWHLGSVAQYHPNVRGYDDFYGFLGGGHNYFPEQYQKAYQKQKAAGKEVIFEYLHPLEHNGEEVKETEYITDALSREAVRFVNDASKKEDPFFLYLAYNAPHTPLEAKDEDLAMFPNIEDKSRKTYAAMVYAVDRGVQKIVNALKETNQLDNTLIVFFSDNGGKTSKGATNFPLREGKGSTCEGGYRVPMFWYWPNQIKGGQKYDFNISALDFYPTFARLAGADIPENKKLDGKDVWDDVLAGKDARKGEYIYALRHREHWSDVGLRRDNWKALKVYNQPWALYNVSEDLGETKNLSNEHPEVLKQMVLEAQRWSQTHQQPQWWHDEATGIAWYEEKMPHWDETFNFN